MAVETVTIVGEVIRFIDITPKAAFSIAGLGFLGGMLSGFIGSGGAFIMTPGMMALGVPGIVAVSSNLAHKLGKAMGGARKHSKMGNVDFRLGICISVFLLLGVNLAVFLNEYIFNNKGKAGSDLYINLTFVVLLSGLSLIIFRDSFTPKHTNETGKPTGLAEKLTEINIPPMINFKIANVRVSLWFDAMIGLSTGWLAGTVGVGGFIGVPAMIYVLGVPTMVAAGTELFLAIFSGALGSFQYALKGFVDIRLVLLLYLGSMLGLSIGVIATKMVSELEIKRVMAVVRITDKFSSTNHSGATGEALREVLKHEAMDVHLDWIQLGPWTSPDEKGFGYVPQFVERLVGFAPMINVKTGKRFIMETGNRKVRADALIELGEPSIHVADEYAVKRQILPQILEGAMKNGSIKQYATLEEVAKAYNIPVEPFVAEIKRWNSFVVKGKDDDFNTMIMEGAKPTQQAPFYVTRLWPKVHHTMGGVVTNIKCQVIDQDFEPIKGLYAAGEVTGGIHGAVRLGGVACTDCIVNGRISGQEAAKEQAWS